MENYLEKLLSQIRCKKARPYIADEIRGHIESQIEDNLSSGMTYEEAEKKAVADMGDPVAVGVSLDKIHKPKVDWKLLAVVAVLSILVCCLRCFWINRHVWYLLCRLHYDCKVFQGDRIGYYCIRHIM